MNARTAIVLVAGLVVLGLAILHRPSQTAPEQQSKEVVVSSGQGLLNTRLPAPRMPVTAAPAPEVQPSELEQTNAFARLLNNDGKPCGWQKFSRGANMRAENHDWAKKGTRSTCPAHRNGLEMGHEAARPN